MLLITPPPFFDEDIQWDQSSPGNSASHCYDQSGINLDFLAA